MEHRSGCFALCKAHKMLVKCQSERALNLNRKLMVHIKKLATEKMRIKYLFLICVTVTARRKSFGKASIFTVRCSETSAKVLHKLTMIAEAEFVCSHF